MIFSSNIPLYLLFLYSRLRHFLQPIALLKGCRYKIPTLVLQAGQQNQNLVPSLPVLLEVRLMLLPNNSSLDCKNSLFSFNLYCFRKSFSKNDWQFSIKYFSPKSLTIIVFSLIKILVIRNINLLIFSYKSSCSFHF